MHEVERKPSDRRQSNGVLAPTVTETDFIFHGDRPFAFPPIRDRSTLLSTRQGAETPPPRGACPPFFHPYARTLPLPPAQDRYDIGRNNTGGDFTILIYRD